MAESTAPAPISPLALEIVRRIDALFEIERGINGKNADERRAARHKLSRPVVEELEVRMRAERPKLSRGSDLAKAMDYMLKRWPVFTRLLDEGRTSASHARGSMAFILAVTIRLYMAAARAPPRSEPADSHDFLPSAIPLRPGSAALFERQTRASSGGTCRAVYRHAAPRPPR